MVLFEEQEVARWFEVPACLVPEITKYERYEQRQQQYVEGTMIPFVRAWEKQKSEDVDADTGTE